MSVTPNYDGMIIEWDVDSRKILHKYIGHEGCVNSAVYSPDGQKILSASNDKTIREWKVLTGAQLEQRECIVYKGHSDWVNSAIYNANGNVVLSASNDGTVKKWNIKNQNSIKTSKKCGSWLNCAIYKSDENHVLFVSGDGIITEWNLLTNKYRKIYENIPGLIINGCTFRNLHPRSELSDELKEVLKIYGAIFD